MDQSMNINGVEAQADAAELQRLRERVAQLEQANEALAGNLARLNQIGKLFPNERAVLRMFLEHIPSFVFVKDTQGRFLLVNDRSIKFLGKTSAKEILGKTDFDFYPPDEAEQYYAAEQEILRTGQPILNRQVRSVDRNGTETWCWVNKIPLHDDEGKIIGLVGVNQDITEQKMAEKTIRESEQRYRLLFENSPIPFWELDLSAIKQVLEQLRTLGLTDLRAYFAAQPDELERCLDLIRVLDVNQTAIHFFQAEHKADLRDHLDRMRLEKSTEGLLGILEALARGESALACEIPLQTWRGEPKHLVLNLQAAPGHEQDLARVNVSTIDITERKRFEEALARERTWLETLIQHIPGYVYAKDNQGRFTLINDRLARELNFDSKDELIGKTDFDIFPAVWAERYHAEERKLFQTGQPILNQEIMGREATPENPIFFSVNKIPLRDAQDNMIGLIGLNYEITERKRAEIALRESEKRYRLLFEEAPIPFFEEDLSPFKQYLDELRASGVNDLRAYFTTHPAEDAHYFQRIRVLDVNQAAVHFFQAPSKEELISHLDRLATDKTHQNLSALFVALAEGQTSFSYETPLRTWHDELRTVVLNLHVAQGHEHDLSKVMISLIDITERKSFVDTLARERTLLHTIINHIPADIYAKDRDGRILLANDNTLEAYPIKSYRESTGEGIIGKTDFDIFPSEWAEQFYAREQEIYRTGQPIHNQEMCHIIDGAEVWAWISKIPMYDATGNAIGLVGINMRITPLKMAEKTIRESEKRYRLLFEEAPIPFFEEDLSPFKQYLDHLHASGIDDLRAHFAAHPEESAQYFKRIRVLDVNQAAVHFFQAPSKEELIANLDRVVTKTTHQVRVGFFLALAQGQTTFSYELPLCTWTGEPRTVVFNMRVAQGHEGDLSKVMISMIDITVRKSFENTLARERALLETLIENIPGFIYAKDPQNRFLLVNQQGVDYYGLQSRDQMLGKTDFDFFPREQAETYLAEEREVYETGQPILNKEISTVNRLSGQLQFFSVSKVPLFDPQGNPSGMVGFNREITAQKEVEQAICRSEERYRLLFEQAPIPFFEEDLSRFKHHLDELRATGITDLRAHFQAHPEESEKYFDLIRILDVNEAALRFFQAPSKTELCRQIRRLLSAQTHPARTAIHIALAEGRTSCVCEIPLQTWSGEPRMVIFNMRVAQAHQQDLARVMVSMIDVTERKLFEESLARERALLEALIENIPNFIYAKDLQGRFLLINHAALKGIHGTCREEVLGKTDFDFFPPEEAEIFWAEEQEVILTGQSIINRERMHVDPLTGQELWFWVTKIPLRNPQGEIIGLVGINHDVTERKQAERAMLRASRMEATATLAGGIAHDFNNLMVGVLGYADLLKMDLGDHSEASQMLDLISQSARQAGQLAQQMLAYAHGGKYHTRAVNLNDTIQETLQLQRHSFSPRIQIELNIEPDLYSIEADPVQMSQVLMNLCINAAEAIEGHGLIKITTRNTIVGHGSPLMHPDLQPGHFVHLLVEDTGCGMSQETMNRVFEPFFTSKFLGRGLGLAAAYGIIKNHGGCILVSSELAKGTLFEIYLPATTHERIGTASSPVTPSPGTETILVIDDELMTLDVAQRILCQYGYQVLTARTGRDAIEIAHGYEEDIDLAILDMGMPVMDGSETFAILRQIRPDIKVIICSGYELDAAAHALIQAGACGFIQKPFQMNTLVQEIRRILDA